MSDTNHSEARDSEGGDSVDLDLVIAEIYDAVAQRRASGELPADLEAELDAEFANYAPNACPGDSLSGVLSQADKAVTIDVDAPTAGRFPAGPVKKGVRKLTFWYMQYLANQVSSFGSATVRALRMLDRRVTVVEQATPGASRTITSTLDAIDPAPLPGPTVDAVVDGLQRGPRPGACTPSAEVASWCGRSPTPASTRTAPSPVAGCSRRRCATGSRSGPTRRPTTSPRWRRRRSAPS